MYKKSKLLYMFWGSRVEIEGRNKITHRHIMHELVIALSDSGRHFISDRMHHFWPGRIFLLAKDIVHGVHPAPPARAAIQFVCFDQNLLIENTAPPVVSVFNRLIRNNEFASAANEEFDRQNIALAESMGSELSDMRPYREAQIGQHVAQLIINLERSLRDTELNPENEDPAACGIQQAAMWIQKHLGRKVSLPEMARRAGLSRTLFCRAFKEKTGMTLSDYTLTARINGAMKLLQHTRQNIAEIAYMCGFNHSTYFHRAFNKKTGMTPAEYRRRIEHLFEHL